MTVPDTFARTGTSCNAIMEPAYSLCIGVSDLNGLKVVTFIACCCPCCCLADPHPPVIMPAESKKPAAMAAAKNFLYFILCPLTHTTFIVRYCRNR